MSQNCQYDIDCIEVYDIDYWSYLINLSNVALKFTVWLNKASQISEACDLGGYLDPPHKLSLNGHKYSVWSWNGPVKS